FFALPQMGLRLDKIKIAPDGSEIQRVTHTGRPFRPEHDAANCERFSDDVVLSLSKCGAGNVPRSTWLLFELDGKADLWRC
ncbi:hypothetical protein ACC732_36905, partial [Rhizobium ruizarguesonis]